MGDLLVVFGVSKAHETNKKDQKRKTWEAGPTGSSYRALFGGDPIEPSMIFKGHESRTYS